MSGYSPKKVNVVKLEKYLTKKEKSNQQKPSCKK
jgi:hypothetical protein